MRAGLALQTFLLLLNTVSCNHQCKFSSPHEKYMIESSRTSFRYQIAKQPSKNQLHIFLSVEGLNDSVKRGYIESCTASGADCSVSGFSNTCGGKTCVYEGYVTLSIDQPLDATPLYFYASNAVTNPVCSLLIIKYNSGREVLEGTFTYDKDRSENRDNLYFKFSPSDDAFPQPIFVEPTLVCPDGDYNLTQMPTENDVFTMVRSKFKSSGGCTVTIYNDNKKNKRSINVQNLIIEQPTTLPTITTPKDLKETVTILIISVSCVSVLAITFFIILCVKFKNSLTIRWQQQSDHSEPEPTDDYRHVQPDPETLRLSNPGHSTDVTFTD